MKKLTKIKSNKVIINLIKLQPFQINNNIFQTKKLMKKVIFKNFKYEKV